MYGGGIKEDFKNAFKRPNSAHYQLIIINVIVFLFLAVFTVIPTIAKLPEVSDFVYSLFNIPLTFAEFLTRPWTIITYAFGHSLGGLFHILFNMLFLYWFSKIIIDFLGNEKVISLYVLGALAGATLYLLLYNFVPYYNEIAVTAAKGSGMIGSSAAVFAIVVGAATIVPYHTFNLIFIGPVKITYIAAFFVVGSFIGLVGDNQGGDIAHLGGALIGYLYVVQLKKGNDMGKWVISFMNFVKSFFIKQPNIKVSYKKKPSASKAKTTSKTKSTRKSASFDASQDEIDAILDKISDKGYESLSKEEKQKLFNASKK